MEKTKTQRRFLALARLCAAGRSGRALDSHVFKALHPDRDWELMGGEWCARCPEDSVAFDTAPAYTTSLDAARAAVPRQPESVEIYWSDPEDVYEGVTVHLIGSDAVGFAPTLELALLQAALTDRAFLAGPKCPGCNEAPAASRQRHRENLCSWCGYNHFTGEQAGFMPASFGQ